MTDQLDEVVEQTYRTREAAWEGALDQVLNWLKRECHELLEDQDAMRLSLDHRIKDQARALDKLRGKLEEDPDLEFSGDEGIEEILGDIVGVKVLCKTPRDQDLICAAMDRLDRNGAISLQGEWKDYVAEPKESGYRARHANLLADVFRSDPVRVEVQVKTRFQDAWSELTHEDLYKPGGAMNPTEFHTSVARTMAALLAEVDRLADDLARDLGTKADEAEAESPSNAGSAGVSEDAGSATAPSELTDVRVRTTGPRYALAVDSEGRQGLMSAKAIRRALGLRGYIKVDEHVDINEEWRVRVVENDDGCFYHPIERRD